MESLLDKATNPRNTYEDWEFIMQVCDSVNSEAEGPQKLLKKIVPKMQSTDEKVALLSLTVIEACVKNCGQRFHQEMGKFKFLNEIIRMLSPKYLASQTPPEVKVKLQFLLYNWKTGLPNEPKIADCYEMLYKCGLVPADPNAPDAIPDEQLKPKVHLKMDRHKEDLLTRLLQSKNPDDLRAANRLIREAVRKDEKRMERLQKRLTELDEVHANVKVLSDMLDHYSQDSTDSDKQLMLELYRKCDEMKPNLFRMANQITNTEEGMAEVLKTNDALLRVLDKYVSVLGEVPPDTTSSNVSSTTTTTTSNTTPTAVGTTSTPGTDESKGGGGMDDLLIQLDDLDLTSSYDQNVPSSQSLADDLGLLGLPTPPPGSGPAGNILDLPDFTVPPMTSSQVSEVPATTPPSSRALLADLDFGSLGPTPTATSGVGTGVGPGVGPGIGTGFGMGPGVGIGAGNTVNPQPTNMTVIPPVSGPHTTVPGVVTPQHSTAPSIPDLHIPPESIQIGDTPPLSVYNKNGLSVTFHFAKNEPAPKVNVVLVSMFNSGVNNLAGVEFQAAVPKSMKVKLQAPTGRDLPPFNPLVPPTSIKQIMLISNPSPTKVKLKYRLKFKSNSVDVLESGDISDFPY